MATNSIKKIDRIKWTQEELRQAVDAVNQRLCNSKAASERYGIPRSTLLRHLKLGCKEMEQLADCSRYQILENFEKDLEEFLVNLKKDDASWTLANLRGKAFEFAEKYNIKHNVNKKKRLANYSWMNSFIDRHPRLAMRKAVVGGLLCINQNKPGKTVNQYLKECMQNATRCKWTEDQLIQAINSVKNGSFSCRMASKKFGIPRTTLIRHIKEGTEKKKRLGRMPIFGKLETELKDFLLNKQSNGNSWSMTELRRIAFNFAETHKIEHKFKRDKGLASYEWVHAFMNRHPEINVQTRKYECSTAKFCKLNKLNEFADMLQIILKEGDEDIFH